MPSGPSPQTDPLIDTVIGDRYRIARSVGVGGMGTVYAATRLDDGQGVALKVLHPEHAGDPVIRNRFVAEADACRALEHPNIVHVLDAGVSKDGLPFLAMDLLEGVPLSAYTQARTRVPAAQAVSITRSILSGLSAAHTAGIVHRDLKPENVFLARDPAGLFSVRILDFGIAKVMDAAGGMGSRTRTGMLLGTPAYMSPEQIKSAKDVDARSDLFSVGVLLYEMVTGRPAFDGETEFTKMMAVVEREPIPADRIDPTLAPFAGFLARAMHKDRNVRFSTADQMGQALAACAPQATAADARALRLPEPTPAPAPGQSTLASGQASGSRPPGGGTMASAPAPHMRTNPPVAIEVLDTGAHPVETGTRGVPPLVVAVLVALALFVGLALGAALRGLTLG